VKRVTKRRVQQGGNTRGLMNTTSINDIRDQDQFFHVKPYVAILEL